MWVSFSISTLIECIDNKDKSVLWVAQKGANQLKEERAFHQLWSKFWVVTKVFCHNGLKGGDVHSEFVDESQKDVDGLAQNQVIPLAEKGTSKVLLLVKACTDGMG